MVLHGVVREDHFDFVVGDEAWDVDHFLHENPNEKRTAFVWMTDFVGWLPMPDGTEREARIAADYNAEMIEHIERFPLVRDRSIFVGNPEDFVPGRFGPDREDRTGISSAAVGRHAVGIRSRGLDHKPDALPLFGDGQAEAAADNDS